MSQPNKFSRQQQEQQAQQAGHETHSAQEFGTPEELLRFDAARTEVPASIARNLQKSSLGMPAASPRPWWRRMFGA